METLKEKAIEYFMNGYSCSESVVQAASDEGLCDNSLLPVATSFSGGMSSGCVCGALAAAQIISGYNFGRDNSKGNPQEARERAKFLVDEFKKRNGATCCKVLSGGRQGIERKIHCQKMVGDACELVEEMFKAAV